MFPLLPSHIPGTNTSNPGLDHAISGQSTSENSVRYSGPTPNSAEHLANVTGKLMRTAFDWLYSQGRNVIEGADAALRFPAAAAASTPILPPILQPDGKMLRTRDMPEWLEHFPEVLRLKEPGHKPDFSTKFHEKFAEELKKTISEMFKNSPVIIVSDQHSWGRSFLLREHLMLAASKGDCVVLMDGTVKGKEKERIQQVFQENYPAGLYLGLEADIPNALTNLMFGHHEFFRLQSLPESALDKKSIRVWFGKLLHMFSDSEAVKKEYDKLLFSAPPDDRVPFVPFINALYDSSQKDAKDMISGLADWYVKASAKDKAVVTLLLKRMMSDLGAYLDKEDASHVSSYLDDPKKNFDDIRQTLALTIRHRTWEKEIEAAYKKHGGKIPVVIFEGDQHDAYITEVVDNLTKKAKAANPEMKSEL